MDQTSSDVQKIDLMKYFDRFFRAFRRLWKYVVLFLLIGILAFEMKEVLFFNTTYTSEAVFVPATSQEDVYYYADSKNGESSNSLIPTFNSLLTSNEMQNVIKDVLHVQSVPATITTTQTEGTNLVTLKVTASNPKDAYNVATCVVNNYDNVTANVMDDVTITLLDNPNMPKSPDANPDYIKAAMNGGMLGLAAGILFLIIASIFRNTILDKRDVRNILGMDYIAKIPFVEGYDRRKKTGASLLLNSPGMKSGFRHAFHNIRIKMEQAHKAKDQSVFMFTSTVPNEGKTLVSVNSAISLGQKGYKVCLVDLDLRNPSVEKTMKYANIKHTSLDFLNDSLISLEDCIVHMDDIDVIFGSDISMDGATELSRPRLSILIEELRKHYDYIILDVPPLFMMQDALLVAKQADSAIVVVKQDHATAADILDSVDELHDTLPNVLGAVLNGYKNTFFTTESSSGYGYGYGFGYGYGYGKR